MDPVAHRRTARDRRRLGDLVLVVGEDVVDAAGVDLEARPEVAQGHRRALEVPAREAVAPRARPAEDPALAGRLPEGEVGRVALVGLDLRSMARPQAVERVARQAAVVGERVDRVVEVAGRREVRMPERLELRRQGEHVGHVLGRPREHVRRQDVDQRLVLVEPRLVGVGDLGRRLGFEARGDQHPVLAAVEPLVAQVPDVRDVLHVEHRDPVVQERPPDEVGEEVAAQVADVRPAVDGGAAGVHPDRAVLGERHRLDAPRQRVAEGRSGRPGGQRRGVGHRLILRRDEARSRHPTFREDSLTHAITKRRSGRSHGRGLADSIVPPAVWHGEASFPARRPATCPRRRRPRVARRARGGFRRPARILPRCVAGSVSWLCWPGSPARATRGRRGPGSRSRWNGSSIPGDPIPRCRRGPGGGRPDAARGG